MEPAVAMAVVIAVTAQDRPTVTAAVVAVAVLSDCWAAGAFSLPTLVGNNVGDFDGCAVGLCVGLVDGIAAPPPCTAGEGDAAGLELADGDASSPSLSPLG